MRLANGGERAILYKSVEAAQRDAAKNGATILSVQPSAKGGK
jgi:hypothetical protein